MTPKKKAGFSLPETETKLVAPGWQGPKDGTNTEELKNKQMQENNPPKIFQNLSQKWQALLEKFVKNTDRPTDSVEGIERDRDSHAVSLVIQILAKFVMLPM